MKNAANRSQSTVKAKAKTLTQVKSVKKMKPAAKKPISKIALKTRRQTAVQKTKAAAKHSAKNSTRNAKPTVKNSAPKLSAKTLNALKTLSARKSKPAVKQVGKPKVKRVAPKTSNKTIETPAQKTKRISSAKKITTVEKKIKKLAAARKMKPKTTMAKPKVSAKPIAKTFFKAAKSQSSKVALRTAKAQKPKVKAVAPSAKIKAVSQKAKASVAAKRLKNTGRTKPIAAAKTVRRKKITPTVPVKRVNRQSKKIQPIAVAKKIVKKTAKAKLISPIKKVARLMQKMKPAISSATLKKQNPKIKKTALVAKMKRVENVIEATMPPPQKQKNRKARPISSAVFRGKKERYDFKVFALNEKFEPIPAVYIISKRKTDRHKRGHHALICIGETASIADELKRHRKGKCVKQHAANVVSILPEGDEKTRLKIETDLKAAHNVVCNFE